ncbi:hypothetical protein [Maribacter sp.]|uniref:hypothetical protein n=1 Tax=Maribacter sp. TaxID=1897614 RepID=UPI0025C5C89B|nr:hypothetical protein [Maribacter sp.]
MERYRNRDSGVKAYQISTNHILVKFDSFKTYKYSYKKAGQFKVEKMKMLAVRGKGLNSFINRYAKYSYD